MCDWRGRGGFAHEVGVDDEGYALLPGSVHPGWITRLVETCEQQLKVPYTGDQGALLTATCIDEWVKVIERAKGRLFHPQERNVWTDRFKRFKNSQREGLNEVGFLLRTVDWVLPRLMRQWYVRAYGVALFSEGAAAEPLVDLSLLFERPALPGSLTVPLVPCVLPFHTVGAIYGNERG